MLSLTTTRDDGFIATPRAPSGTSPDMVALFDRISRAFVSNDETITSDWTAAKTQMIATPCRTGIDIATKLLIAMHDIAPHRQDGELGFDPGDFVTDESIQLLASAVNDALALEMTPPPFIDALVQMMKANHVSLAVQDGKLSVAFAQTGTAGRGDGPDGLDGIDGAQRALYALMCAVPGATEAVRAAVAGEAR